MKKMLVLLPALLFFTTMLVDAQSKKAVASFAKEVHDFGKIKEADGPVTYQFEFTNTGGEPLIISNVATSCGCTTPNYPKDPVLPGAKRSITVSYNPAGRPGRFEKTITIYTNGDPDIYTLKITGEVIPKEPTIEDMYPNNVEGLRMRSLQIAFNNIAPSEKATQTVDVVNSTDTPMKVDFMDVPSFITVKITPPIIPPKGKAQLTITYDAAAKNDWGFVYDRLGLVINNKQLPGRLSVTANIQEDFSKLTDEQKKNAPKVEVDKAEFDFGTIKPGEVVKYDFVLKNTGKSDLIIRKTTASCGCTVANVKSKVIKPGESTTLSAEFNSAGRSGTQSKTITVITNDPNNQRLILWLKGKIAEN
ncbi:MAG: DUF1573 domain-containing protein [Bacteroidales bacterium]|nr:DUF1573 domain-containing protein [Bacteroidales bacterium]